MSCQGRTACPGQGKFPLLCPAQRAAPRDAHCLAVVRVPRSSELPVLICKMDPGSLPWWVPKETLTNAQRPCCAGVEELNFSRGAGASRVPRPAPQVSLGGGPTGGPSGPFRAPRARARLPEATPPPDPRQVRSLVPQDARAPPGRRAAGKRAGGGLRVPGSHAAARPRPWCTVGVAAPTPRPSGWGRGLEAWGRGGHAPRSLTGRLWTRVPRSARPPPSPRPRGSHLGGSGNRVGSGQAAWVLASVYAPGSRIRHRAWGGRVEDGQGSPCGDPLGGDCKVPMGAGDPRDGGRFQALTAPPGSRAHKHSEVILTCGGASPCNLSG